MRCEPAPERRGIEFLTSAAAYATERTERAAACDIFVFELTHHCCDIAEQLPNVLCGISHLGRTLR